MLNLLILLINPYPKKATSSLNPSSLALEVFFKPIEASPLTHS